MRDKAEAHQNEVKPRQEGNKGGGPQESSQAAAASPPSASSSPTHEFSFTISLHHPVPPATTAAADKATAKHPPPSIAVDLSPADEIFFHGHLLPLHLLSHLPVSPRSSTNSLDSFTLPIKDLLENDSSVPFTPNSFSNSAVAHNNSSSANIETNERPRPKPKSKSFSLFGRWRKGVEMREKEERERAKRSKQRFDMSHVLKRYMRMVRPLLSSLRGKRDNLSFSRQPYSFSGILTPRGRQELRGGEGSSQRRHP
ncbi:hypothetical protein NMG60_11016410 [Bertholletia excelsa]